MGDFNRLDSAFTCDGSPEDLSHFTHGALKGDREDMITLVDDDEARRLCDFAQILPTGEALRHRDVDGALRFVAAPTKLTDLLGADSEVLSKALSPLLDEGPTRGSHGQLGS